jgi:hypothetical protein
MNEWTNENVNELRMVIVLKYRFNFGRQPDDKQRQICYNGDSLRKQRISEWTVFPVPHG